MPTILITGGTGLIGTALSKMLAEKGYDVILMTRSAGPGNEAGVPVSGSGIGGRISRAQWDPEKGTIDKAAIGSADHIIHLAGAGVADKRWSVKRKKEIVESRTHSSALIIKALRETSNKVQSVISASGIGWYGADPSIPNPQPFVETDAADEDFLGETCRLWEDSIRPAGKGGGEAKAAAGTSGEAAALGKRLVIFRTGIVLSKKGGALAEFRKPARLGVAAILGSGRQVISWIHIDDLCRLYIAAIEDTQWSGVYNAVAPQPVDNRTLTIDLARRMKGRYFVPVYVPSFLLKIAIGEMSVEVLKSATVSMEKTRRAGFQFLHPSIQSALDDLVR